MLYVQSEAEQECGSVMSVGNRKNIEKKRLVRTRSSSDMVDQLKGLRTWSSQHSAFESSHDSALNLVPN